MAYDADLANRIRMLFGPEPGLSEMKMFGGLAFLINGNMTIAASGSGGLLVRVDPAMTDKITSSTSAGRMEMRGRSMPGWLRVAAKDADADKALSYWVELSSTYTRTLPPKAK